MTYNRQCDICKEYNGDVNHVVRISDTKDYKEINGHEECMDQFYEKVKSMDIEKLTVENTLVKLGINK